MTADALVAVMDGTAIGTVVREPSGRLRFDYADAWRRHSDAVPLSLSMPLVRATHPHAVVDAFLWGLLPDNEQILARWSRQFHVSARNAFGLLAHIGVDCAGAVQFVPIERLPALQKQVADDIEGWTKRRSASACAPCGKTLRPPDAPPTMASSVSLARNRRRRCCGAMATGACLPGARPPRTS
ncbi:MAG: HipA N-terminal domain-containing protein [Rhodanobacter sp.]